MADGDQSEAAINGRDEAVGRRTDSPDETPPLAQGRDKQQTDFVDTRGDAPPHQPHPLAKRCIETSWTRAKTRLHTIRIRLAKHCVESTWTRARTRLHAIRMRLAKRCVETPWTRAKTCLHNSCIRLAKRHVEAT